MQGLSAYLMLSKPSVQNLNDGLIRVDSATARHLNQTLRQAEDRLCILFRKLENPRYIRNGFFIAHDRSRPSSLSRSSKSTIILASSWMRLTPLHASGIL